MIPFSFTIKNLNDILVLEKKIRLILQCEGSFCSFLQSVPYKHLKFILQSKHYEGPVESRMFRIPNSSFVLCLMDNNKTVIGIDSQSVGILDFHQFQDGFNGGFQSAIENLHAADCDSNAFLLDGGQKRKHCQEELGNFHMPKGTSFEESMIKRRKI